MNLNNVSPEEKLKICRRYFHIGCFGLPFVWLINSVWFFREAFFKKDTPLKLRWYVLASLLGLLIWSIVFVIWTSVYQTQRVKWGAPGVRISFVVPSGKP